MFSFTSVHYRNTSLRYLMRIVVVNFLLGISVVSARELTVELPPDMAKSINQWETFSFQFQILNGEGNLSIS